MIYFNLYNSSPRSSRIWFSYIPNLIIIIYYYNALETSSVLERSWKERHGIVEGLKGMQHEVMPLAVECMS